MADQSPPARVVAAMPGTVGELSKATGYPAGEVLKQIGNARREGKRVNAVEDGISRGVGRHLDRENPHESTTIFMLDNSTQREVQ